MRRRYIALKPAEKLWAFAVAAGDQAQAELLQTGTFERDAQRPLADQLTELLGPLQLTDRLACALPASSAMVRWLEFPFSDARKIAAAALPEMARELPCNLANQAVFHQPAGSHGTLTVAVDRQRIEDLLAGFDDNREPLGYIGLSPFCYAAALDWPVDALLLCCEDDEISLSRIENGNLVDLRILPHAKRDDAQEIARQARLLAQYAKTPLHRLRLLGNADSEQLANALEKSDFEVEPVRLGSLSVPAEDELCGVACLALAATKADAQTLNLRSGPYKLKTEWQALKRRMWVAAALAMCGLLIFTANGFLQYRQRASELKSLQQQMDRLYHQQFPGEKLLVAAPLQLQSKMKELQKKTSQFGSGSPGALEVLLAVSQAIPADLKVDIHEYQQSEDGLRLTGNTTNFDAVSKVLASLQKVPQFSAVRILDSKQAIDGSKVDFQLQVQLGEQKGD